jgi:L-alanine-DL-glutamate epimerase-like enolase superfamily enzyme
MSVIKRLSHRVVVRPMKTTFATSLGAKKAATSVLVKVSLSDGRVGLGEVPTSFVMPHETPAAISAILNEAREMFTGNPIEDYPQVLPRLQKRHPTFHMTLAGLEVALFRAALPVALSARRPSLAAAPGGGSQGWPPPTAEWRHWGGRSTMLETDITIPFVPNGDELKAWLRRITPKGFTTYKIKVSGRIDQDMAFLNATREILHAALPRFVIRLDGNQGYTSASYAEMIMALEKARMEVELFEQPLRKGDFAGLRRIRGIGRAPVVLDETVFRGEDCRRVIEGDLGDGVNVKIAKSGLAESAAIMRLARQAGLKLMIGCMTETMVGLSAGIRLAAGSGAFDYVDLDSIHFLYHPPRTDGIAIDGSRYVLETC